MKYAPKSDPTFILFGVKTIALQRDKDRVSVIHGPQ